MFLEESLLDKKRREGEEEYNQRSGSGNTHQKIVIF